MVNEKLFRPAEVNILLGNPKKARMALKWKHEVRFEELVYGMVEGDLRWYAREAAHYSFWRYPARRRRIGEQAEFATFGERMMSFPLRCEPGVYVVWPSGMKRSISDCTGVKAVDDSINA